MSPSVTTTSQLHLVNKTLRYVDSRRNFRFEVARARRGIRPTDTMMEGKRRQEDAAPALSYGLNSLSLNCKVAFGEFNAGNRDGVSFVSQRSSSTLQKNIVPRCRLIGNGEIQQGVPIIAQNWIPLSRENEKKIFLKSVCLLVFMCTRKRRCGRKSKNE